MKALPFQIHLCICMVRCGVFGPEWSFQNPADQYASDFPSMISSIQETIDYLKTIKPGDEGEAEGRWYSYWPSGMLPCSRVPAADFANRRIIKKAKKEWETQSSLHLPPMS